MIQAELRIATGNKQGNSISLPQGKFLVGREEDCHLRPNSDLVSRHHCVFSVDEFTVRLRDLGSTNGTFVNGQRLVGAVNLKQGDRVLIGKLDFEVMMQDVSTAKPAFSDLETVMIAGSPEAASASTQFAMPVLDLNAALPSSASTISFDAPPTGLPPAMVPASADTQVVSQQQPGMMPPGYGMPVGYPQQQPQYMPQNPYGYPGYPPQMPMQQMPGYYGQPMYPQMQMPMQQMMPPGYGMPQQPMMMPQQMMPVEEAPPAGPTAGDLGVKLPDPSSTGAKAPPPPAAPVAAVPGAAAPAHIPTAAADIIKQYMTRR